MSPSSTPLPPLRTALPRTPSSFGPTFVVISMPWLSMSERNDSGQSRPKTVSTDLPTTSPIVVRRRWMASGLACWTMPDESKTRMGSSLDPMAMSST